MVTTGVSSDSSSVLVLSRSDVRLIIIFLVFVALIIILQPLLLSSSYNRRKELPDIKAKDAHSSFFEIEYITWFLIHYGIAALAVIAILILGLDNIIDKTTVSALLGSLFGYVLGSSSKGAQYQSKEKKPDSNSDKPDNKS